MDPRETPPMTRSELVKFRITPKAKGALLRLADARGTTVSALLREQTARLTMGTPSDPQVRADLATVRQLANAILAGADSAFDTAAIVDAATKLRAIATRHLGQPS